MEAGKKLLVLVGFGALLSLAACGGGSGAVQPPPVQTPSVSVRWSTPPPSALSIGIFTTFGAVANDASNAQVTWTVTCGSQGACGSFGQTNPTIPDVVFTAPSAIPTGKTVTVTATSVADPTKSISATITITATILFYGIPPASLQVGRAASIAALVGPYQNAYGDAQVSWAVSCGGSDCGSVSSALSANEMPVTYTAPSALPPGNTIKVTATSVADPTQFVWDEIAVTPSVQNLADGTYVFQQGGLVGSFIHHPVRRSRCCPGGTSPHTMLTINGGNYSTTPGGNFQVTLWGQDGATIVFNGVLSGDGQSLVAEIFGSGNSGTLVRQTNTAAPSRSFVFGLYEPTPASIAGVLNVDSHGGISGTGSELDFLTNVNYPDLKLSASTVSAPDPFGRVVFKLYTATGSPTASIFLVGYVADATHIRLVETSGDTLGNTLIGYAIGQGSAAGAFTPATVGGSRFVAAANGLYNDGLSNGGLGQMVAQFNAEVGGSLTGNLTWQVMHTGAGTTMPNPITGSWNVDSMGRMTFSLQTTAGFTTNCVLYLIGDGSGILLTDTTNNIQFTGQAFARAAGSPAPSALAGNFGSVLKVR